MTIREPGTLVDGRYKLERVLGRGGMGAVYEATQKPLGRRVALKMLHSKLASDNPDVISRFHQEAKLAASIGHDNICEVTDMGTDSDGCPYLVMPLLKGSPMNAIMREHRLSLARIVPMFSQILSGLQAAHSAKIVHRDLKPANIYVCKIGPHDDFIKLLDFGISKVLSQETVTTLTRTGEILGTPHYMSPEQAMDPKYVDHRSDIYAVGVMLYEAVLQRLPFEGKSYAEVLYKIISEPIPAPRQVMPSLPESMEAVIIKAMARDRQDRFQHAAQFQTALEQCLKEIRRGSYDPGTPPELTDSRARVSTGVDMHQATTRHPSSSVSRDPISTASRKPHEKKGAKAVAILSALAALGVIAASGLLILHKRPEPAASVIPAVQQPLSPASALSAEDRGTRPAPDTEGEAAEIAPRLQLVDPVEPSSQNGGTQMEEPARRQPPRPGNRSQHERESVPAKPRTNAADGSVLKEKKSQRPAAEPSREPKNEDEDIYQNPVDVW